MGSKSNRKILYILIALYTGGVLVRPLPSVMTFSGVELPAYCLSILLCCTACIYWIFSINRRIIDRRQRIFLILTAVMLLLLHTLQILKYCFAGDSGTLRRYLWYSYYVPMTLSSMFSVFAAISTGRSEKEPLPKKSYAFVLAALIIIFAALTNDRYQMMFRFPAGIEEWEETYSNMAFLYIQRIYAYALLLLSLGIAIRKCTVESTRRRAAVPLISVAAGLILMLVFFGEVSGGRKIFGIEFFTFQMIWDAMFVLFWETCIQVGLVPSNSDYGMIFENSSVSARISDLDGNIVYSSREAVGTVTDIAKGGDDFTAVLEGDTKFYGMRIKGGYIYWQEDIGKLLAMNNELFEAGERLHEENTILAQENDLKEEQISIETSKRLYDAIAFKVKDRARYVEELLAKAENAPKDVFDRIISEVSVYMAYIKRTANLELMREDRERISALDLKLAIKESMEYASVSGLVCDVSIENDGEADAGSVNSAYDLFEEVLEKGYKVLHALMIWIDVKDSLSVRIEMARGGDAPESEWNDLTGHIRDMARRHSDYRMMALGSGEDDDIILRVEFADPARKEAAL